MQDQRKFRLENLNRWSDRIKVRQVSNTIEKLRLYTEVLRLGDHAANFLLKFLFFKISIDASLELLNWNIRLRIIYNLNTYSFSIFLIQINQLAKGVCETISWSRKLHSHALRKIKRKKNPSILLSLSRAKMRFV